MNREEELKRLRAVRESRESQLIVLYGRRRIGKTRLLREILGEEDIFFTADQREKPEQIRSFVSLVDQALPGFARVRYPDWESFFMTLKERWRKPGLLVIDEFPYLLKNAPELSSIIQKLFDRRDEVGFHLVLCGSSQQRMQQLVMDSTSPMFGRCNEIIRLRPMGIHAFRDALEVSPVEAVKEYSVWGGIPRYWELREQTSSFREAVLHHALAPAGALYDEPYRLFMDDSRDAVQMSTLITLVASGANRLSEIAARSGKPATHLSRPLQKLIDLGYLKRETPFGLSPRNTKKSVYRIADPFMRFFFTFVLPSKSALELGHAEMIYREVVSPGLSHYTSGEWEQLCRNAVPSLMDGNAYAPGQRWWGRGKDGMPMEIDLVSSSYDGKSLLIGEVKWSSTANIGSLLKELERKKQQLPFGDQQQVVKALFLKKHPPYPPESTRVFTPAEIVNIPS